MSKYILVNRHLFIVAVAILSLFAALPAGAQGTAFNYQGKLNDGGSPATGLYDLRFAIFSAVTNGSQVSILTTNSATAVTNGLFSVTLDFGAGLFAGSNYWIDISVRTNGAAAFTTLVPRQPILPVPYAIFANSASNLLGVLTAAQFSGNLPASQVAGGSTNAVNFTNLNNLFYGVFTGNGSSLSNLNANQITTGTVADVRLSANVALLNTNQTFTGTNNFTGVITSTGTNSFNGVNTFSNWNNSFTGNFFGNGLVGWIVTNGSAVQAARDHGYAVTNPGVATITLPANANLTNGDIVRISGAGAGGWVVQLNSGQTVTGNFASYTNAGIMRLMATNTGSTSYQQVAASADGTRVYYAGSGVTGVEISDSSGVLGSWNPVTTPYFSGSVYSIACSANGKIVYAEPGAGGVIQKSTDGGITWVSSGFSATTKAIACSDDGSQLFSTANYACSGNGTYLAKWTSSTIVIYTNGMGGSSFSVSPPPGTIGCVAASSDCTRLLVGIAGISGGQLFASSNQGKTWTPLTSANQSWSGAWMSPDGGKFAASAIKSGGLASGVYFGAANPLPRTATTNSIAGSQGCAVELQYLGNGQFIPVSSTGLIWAN